MDKGKGRLRLLLLALAVAPLLLWPGTGPIRAATNAEVTVETRSASPGATTIIRVLVSGVPAPGLGLIQIGPRGELTYDPQVMEVLAVTGITPYTITAQTIDNGAGSVRFTASAPAEAAKTEGAVVELEVRAVGNLGESTPIRISRIDALRDPQGNDIAYTTIDGRLTIKLNPPPQAAFSVSPEKPFAGETLQFSDESSDDGKIIAWEWEFGDGATSNDRNPTHRYKEVGVFTVKLTVTDNEGAIGRAVKELVVYPAPPNQPPIAYFTFSPTRPTVGDEVRFTDHSSDPDGQITFRFWDFGDGSSSTVEAPSHRYSASGRYRVTLTVADNRGATDSFFRELTVFKVAVNEPPQAAFTFAPTSPSTQDTVKFFSQASDPDGEVVLWFWDFGDGTTSTLRDPEHRYKKAGTYKVTLKVADDRGATGLTSQQITVAQGAAGAPQAAFSFAPESPQPGQLVRFTDRSTDPDGTIKSWAWEFGDGSTATEQNPAHKYAKRGVYTVKLTVTDNDGLTGSTTKQIRVGQVQPSVTAHCYPNPASTQTTFKYALPSGAAKARLRLFAATGRLVFEQELTLAAQEFAWNLKSAEGQPLPNGAYFYYIQALGPDGQALGRSAVQSLLIQR
ncbi:MAG: PKD domain-containing protein [Candidatus Acetothermia bacterium]|jgi:PKD repeat protein|nr:PKD domain-containing protein [Candidatus Acetothermia bacterium]MDH7505996.1 PKD domain-containing protein [Candidatus Acetothermia bacterium]